MACGKAVEILQTTEVGFHPPDKPTTFLLMAQDARPVLRIKNERRLDFLGVQGCFVTLAPHLLGMPRRSKGSAAATKGRGNAPIRGLLDFIAVPTSSPLSKFPKEARAVDHCPAPWLYLVFSCRPMKAIGEPHGTWWEEWVGFWRGSGRKRQTGVERFHP